MAKAPVKRRYNTDTNQWEVVKPRTGPTPASNTRKKMRAAAAAKAAAPKPAAKPKPKAPAKKAVAASTYNGPYGANASVASAQPKGPTARGGKRPAPKAPGGARPEGPAGSMPVPAAPGATGPSVRMRKRKPKVLGLFDNYNETLRKENNKVKLAASRKGRTGGLYLGTHPGAAGYGK